MEAIKIFTLFVLILFTTACSEKEQSVISDPEQQTQQQFIVNNLQEEAEEPEYIIEEKYDKALAEKAAKNKKNRAEKIEPIILTPDDDDLREDLNDIPSEVKRNTPRGISPPADYTNTDVARFDKLDGNVKGVSAKKELFYVVAGAYRTKADAAEKVKAIQELGYVIEFVTFDKNFQTVSVAELESRKQANDLVNILKRKNIDASVIKRRAVD